MTFTESNIQVGDVILLTEKCFKLHFSIEYDLTCSWINRFRVLDGFSMFFVVEGIFVDGFIDNRLHISMNDIENIIEGTNDESNNFINTINDLY